MSLTYAQKKKLYTKVKNKEGDVSTPERKNGEIKDKENSVSKRETIPTQGQSTEQPEDSKAAVLLLENMKNGPVASSLNVTPNLIKGASKDKKADVRNGLIVNNFTVPVKHDTSLFDHSSLIKREVSSPSSIPKSPVKISKINTDSNKIQGLSIRSLLEASGGQMKNRCDVKSETSSENDIKMALLANNAQLKRTNGIISLPVSIPLQKVKSSTKSNVPVNNLSHDQMTKQQLREKIMSNTCADVINKDKSEHSVENNSACKNDTDPSSMYSPISRPSSRGSTTESADEPVSDSGRGFNPVSSSSSNPTNLLSNTVYIFKPGTDQQKSSSYKSSAGMTVNNFVENVVKEHISPTKKPNTMVDNNKKDLKISQDDQKFNLAQALLQMSKASVKSAAPQHVNNQNYMQVQTVQPTRNQIQTNNIGKQQISQAHVNSQGQIQISGKQPGSKSQPNFTYTFVGPSGDGTTKSDKSKSNHDEDRYSTLDKKRYKRKKSDVVDGDRKKVKTNTEFGSPHSLSSLMTIVSQPLGLQPIPSPDSGKSTPQQPSLMVHTAKPLIKGMSLIDFW